MSYFQVRTVSFRSFRCDVIHEKGVFASGYSKILLLKNNIKTRSFAFFLNPWPLQTSKTTTLTWQKKHLATCVLIFFQNSAFFGPSLGNCQTRLATSTAPPVPPPWSPEHSTLTRLHHGIGNTRPWVREEIVIFPSWEMNVDRWEDIHPWSLTARPWKMVVGRLLFDWEGNLSGAMFNFRWVLLINALVQVIISNCLIVSNSAKVLNLHQTQITTFNDAEP